MGTVSAMLLSCLLAADDPAAAGVPLTDDELQIAVAALEEQHSRLRSFQVTYRRWREEAPADNLSADPPADEYTVEWSWRSGQAHFLRTGNQSRKEWWYDGEKAYLWHFKRGNPSKIVAVSIYHWLPEQAVNYDMALVTGFGGPYFEGGVIARVKAALGNSSFYGQQTERGWQLAMGTQEVNRARYDMTALLDSGNDYRLVSWELQRENSPSFDRHIVDEFQSVTDEADGSSLWYPLRAHMEQAKAGRFVVTQLAVDSVRINGEMLDSEFTPPEMPFGTEVHEIKEPGAMPKTYLVGGEDAEEARLNTLVEMAKRMSDRSEREAIAVDATPKTASNPLPWFISGALLIGLGCFLYWRRHRAA